MKTNKKFRFVLCVSFFMFVGLSNVFAETYNNFDKNALKSCGDGFITGIPSLIPQVISIVYTIIQIAVPIILVIAGSIDLIKGIISQKEDELKKNQSLFIKRLIYGILIFFVFTIVKLVISLTADNGNKTLECAECFIKNSCD